MSFRLEPKSVTLNDLERRNGRYIALFTELGKHTLQRISDVRPWPWPEATKCRPLP